MSKINSKSWLPMGAALLVCGCALLPSTSPAADPSRDEIVTFDGHPSQYVNPFVGTMTQPDAHFGPGATFPGAVAPMGMMQWSPDTTKEPGGYSYKQKIIRDFSLTHFSGRGCSCYQDIGFMPFVGTVDTSPGTGPELDGLKPYSSTYIKDREAATAGFYSTFLDKPGVQVDLTVSTRSGIGRFTYPASKDSVLLINAGTNAKGASEIGTGVMIVGNDEVRGQAAATIGCGREPYTMYFDARFDRPFSAYGTWKDAALSPKTVEASGAKSGAYLVFDTTKEPVVKVRVGISFVNIANARANVDAEIPAWDFDKTKKDVEAAWDKTLGRIEVSGGTRDQTSSFYTALYHSFIHPNVFNDINGEYIGFDNKTHTVDPGHTQYENIPGWDEYRSLCQLRAVLDPAGASDIIRSMLNDAQQNGPALPRWEQVNHNSNGMVGDSPDAYVANVYAYGARDFDAKAALAAMEAAAARESAKSDNHNVRGGQKDYVDLGYVSGEASVTLEYCTDDFALSRFAEAMGDSDNAKAYLARAQNWRNLYNQESGYIQPKDKAGAWTAGFTPTSGKGFVEGDSAQYTWMIPFNLKGLVAAMGGNETVVNRLDEHFKKLNGGPGSPYGFIGNEPEEGGPWVYDFAGAPWRTQDVIRRIRTELFPNNPGGLPGNDDAGALSSWDVFASIGLYPDIPGVAGFVVGSPMFPTTSLHLGTGNDLKIEAPAAKEANPYVQDLTIDGKSTTHLWIPFNDLRNGATLHFNLGPDPNKQWGSRPEDAPPSFDK